MGIISKPRLLLAVAGLWTLVLMFWYHESLTPLAQWAQLPSSIFKPGSEGVTAENALANDNAHKLPTADSFLGHFRKVVQIPGITVAEAQRSCNWDAALPVNFQFDDHVDWAEKLRSDDEVATRRGQWRKFITEEAIPYEAVKQRFGGRGLVIVAGNGDTISRAKVSLRALRKLGSKIPIEFHYWNDEMNGSIKADLAGLYPNLFFNDLSGEHNIVRVQKNFFRINYQLKPAALMNSRFAEPLLLDTDNIPVLDPATLYDTKTYQEYGTVFWPDIARTRPQNPAWAITNTPCRMNEYEVESGQLLVDKTRFWYHLQLAAWMSNDTAGYYDEFLLGDKDMFRFSWHALKTRYGQPKKWLTSVGTLNDGFYCGHTFAQHHPDDGRVAFLHGGLTKTVSPEVLRWNRVERGGFYRHYKRSISDERPDKITNVTIKFDGADYVPSHSANFRVAMCTDMFNTEARDLNEILPGFEALFEEIRGYWQLDRVH